jgi:hypothetical protein
VGPVRNKQKLCWDVLRRTFVFASGGICGSHCAFRCIRDTSHRHTIFHARVGPVRILQKCIRTRYVERLFSHPVGSAGHVVHFDGSGVRIVDTQFFKLGLDRYGFDKKRFRTRYGELVFSHPVGPVGHVVHSCAFGVRNVDALFFMLQWHRYGFEE